MSDHSVAFVLRSFDGEDRNLRFADFVGQCDAFRKSIDLHRIHSHPKNGKALTRKLLRLPIPVRQRLRWNRNCQGNKVTFLTKDHESSNVSWITGIIGREVRAKGKLTYRSRENFPAYIQVQELEILPPDEDLPSIMEIKGIAPNLTGGKSSEEFIRGLRDGEEKN